MSKKLTPWFPAHVKPARNGVYETNSEIQSGSCYQMWDGRTWGACSYVAWMCHTPDEWRSIHQSPKWRGLAVKP